MMRFPSASCTGLPLHALLRELPQTPAASSSPRNVPQVCADTCNILNLLRSHLLPRRPLTLRRQT
eukprot:15479170-Alexandrium_andersonii.AAC.1